MYQATHIIISNQKRNAIKSDYIIKQKLEIRDQRFKIRKNLEFKS